jgi:nucleotide-binding universal stress UspA family protein
MNKRILISTDFSKNALNAARYALDLYAKLNCEFYFLNVIRLGSYTLDPLQLPEPGSAEYKAAKAKSNGENVKLLKMLELHRDTTKHTFHTISTFDKLTEAMKEIIAQKDIDLVIMGTRGATADYEIIFGGNTVNAMEEITECPVLAIPPDIRFSPPKEIVFPTDYKSVFKRRELKYLIEIAKLHKAAIRILYVNKKPDLSKSQEINQNLLKEIFGPVEHSFHTLQQKKVAEALTTFVESRESDMIAFMNHKHFFFGSVFSRPLVKEIGYDATVPILALH